jgi:hypothetical protein
LFKVLYRCSECSMEMDHPVTPHFKTFTFGKARPCHHEPELTMIASLKDVERGSIRRGFVPAKDFLEGDEWAVDSSWDDAPPDTLQVAVVPLPKDGYLP